MSFRAIEMQIAIPRTSEAGTVQSQLMQKSAFDQSSLAAKQAQESERQLQRSTKVEESSSPLIRDDSQEGSKGKRDRKTNKTKQSGAGGSSPSVTSHPYKGHHIDLSL